MINKLRKAAKTAYNTGQDIQVNPGLILALLDRLEAAGKSLAQPVVEPVAEYVVRTDAKGKKNGICYLRSGAYDLIDGSYMLYTSPPAECDVRKIMLEVVRGADGEGHEVYAKNVSEVVTKLTEMGQRIEDLEGSPPPPPAEVPMLSDEEIDRMLRVQVPGGSSARDWFLPHDGSERGTANIRTVVRLMFQQAVRREAGLK